MGKICFVQKKLGASPSMALGEIKMDYSDDIEFRSPHDPDHSTADDLVIGKCLKTYKRLTEQSKKEANKIAEKHYAETNTVDYINAGQDGYYRLEAAVSKNRKRGQTYYVAAYRGWGNYNRIRSFETKGEAEKYAKKYAAQNLEKSIKIINQKNEKVASIYFNKKYYKTKPKLAKKDGRVLLPACYYVMTGTAHIG